MGNVINVVTSFSPAGYECYGRSMLQSFAEHWPHEVNLYAYHESKIPSDASGRAIWVNLDRDRDRARFMATHKDANRKDYSRPEQFIEYYTRLCPVKFSHKVWAATSAPRDCDWLIWMDGDVETLQPVTWDFLNELLPQEGPLGVFLGRRWWTHTETGFWAIRMNGYGKHFLDELRDHYISDKIMFGTHTTDCAAFDYCLQIFEGRGQKFKDLGSHYKGPSIDVMAKSVLAPYFWHNKSEGRKYKAYGRVA